MKKYLGTPKTFFDHVHKLHVVHEYYIISEIMNWLYDNVIVCLTPRDHTLVQNIHRRFGISIDIPKAIPNLNITPDDEILIVNYWRSKRRFDVKDIMTYDECLCETSFSFVVWKPESSCDFQPCSNNGFDLRGM